MQAPKKKILLSYFYSYVCCLLMAGLMGSCALFGSGARDRGDFRLGLKQGTWTNVAPAGMQLVPGGAFMTGEVNEDILGVPRPNRRITVSSFYMDDTPVTNAVYRKFIEILLDKVGASKDKDVKEEGDEQEGEEEVQQEENQDEDEQQDVAKDETSKADQEKVAQKDMYEAELTVEFIMTKLYPDSAVWRNDFSNHMADILLDGYHEHPAYNEYPVVGISWEAARRFAAWRTKYFNEFRALQEEDPIPNITLPSEAQWTYAARGGMELAKYPWGGPYVRNYEGELRANFKSGKGNYNECGYAYTSPVKAFAPNDYGLYDMAGNVSEWTLDAYNPAAVSRIWDLDPLYLDDNQPLKITKGGSWKDPKFNLETGTVDCEHKDSARSYIGFRCVMPYIGLQNITMPTAQ
jgi:gliding motility-associated lipoprotein GldK